jgi:hypothetical protein
MAGKKLPDSLLRPGATNYGNARGREAVRANEGIEEEINPGVSPGSVAELPEPIDEAVPKARHNTQEFHDRNFAQYMNRGDGRYVKPVEDQAEGSFGPDKDHGGRARQIHRQKRL